MWLVATISEFPRSQKVLLGGLQITLGSTERLGGKAERVVFLFWFGLVFVRCAKHGGSTSHA